MRAVARLELLEINFLGFFCSFFLSPGFHENWHSLMNTHLITEVEQQLATLVLGWVTLQVLDQLWEVSESIFVFLARL